MAPGAALAVQQSQRVSSFCLTVAEGVLPAACFAGGVCRLCWWTLGSGQCWRTGELDLPHAATACSVQPRSPPGTAQWERPVSFSAAPPREISIRDEEWDRPHYTPVDRGDSSASPPVGWQRFCTPLVQRAGRESTRLPPPWLLRCRCCSFPSCCSLSALLAAASAAHSEGHFPALRLV